jgi:hypothetical protein
MRAIRSDDNGVVAELRPGSELAGYRIEAVEREDAGAAVLRARDPLDQRAVTLHVAGEPPGALSTTRFLERARRLGAVEHPHLLGVYSARTLEGRAVAVAQAPPGRRLDGMMAEGPLGTTPTVRIVRQVASAVDALEGAGAEPPPLTAERIWVDGAGDAHLDGFDARSGIGMVQRAPSSSAALAGLIGDMTTDVSAPLRAVLTRALDGAYLSAGQLADALRDVEAGAARRRRDVAVAIAVLATLITAVILLASLI